MNIYVDKLPNSCIGCPYCFHECRQTYICVMQNKLFDLYTNEDYFKRQEGCPLHLLAEHDKQVRKEACDEIRKYFDKNLNTCDEYNCCGFSGKDIKDVYKLLDQIQEANNENNN